MLSDMHDSRSYYSIAITCPRGTFARHMHSNQIFCKPYFKHTNHAHILNKDRMQVAFVETEQLKMAEELTGLTNSV